MNKTIVTFDPMNEFRQMQQVFDRLFDAPVRETRGLVFPVDVFEKEGALVVRASAPGVAPADLDVQIENDVLTIRGEVKSDTDLSDAKVYRREVAFGSFTRSVRLPDGLDLDRVEATFSHGVVTIRLPRVEAPQPAARKIDVRTPEPDAPTAP